MGTNEIVGSFTNEQDVEVECKRIYTWRNWRVSHLVEIKNKLSEMWDEDLFVLQWLNANDIYQALDPSFIEEVRSHKLSIRGVKGKGVVFL